MVSESRVVVRRIPCVVILDVAVGIAVFIRSSVPRGSSGLRFSRMPNTHSGRLVLMI